MLWNFSNAFSIVMTRHYQHPGVGEVGFFVCVYFGSVMQQLSTIQSSLQFLEPGTGLFHLARKLGLLFELLSNVDNPLFIQGAGLPGREELSARQES